MNKFKKATYEEVLNSGNNVRLKYTNTLVKPYIHEEGNSFIDILRCIIAYSDDEVIKTILSHGDWYIEQKDKNTTVIDFNRYRKPSFEEFLENEKKEDNDILKHPGVGGGVVMDNTKEDNLDLIRFDSKVYFEDSIIIKTFEDITKVNIIKHNIDDGEILSRIAQHCIEYGDIYNEDTSVRLGVITKLTDTHIFILSSQSISKYSNMSIILDDDTLRLITI